LGYELGIRLIRAVNYKCSPAACQFSQARLFPFVFTSGKSPRSLANYVHMLAKSAAMTAYKRMASQGDSLPSA